MLNLVPVQCTYVSFKVHRACCIEEGSNVVIYVLYPIIIIVVVTYMGKLEWVVMLLVVLKAYLLCPQVPIL